MTAPHPDTRHLRCFAAAAEAGSIRAAARRLGLAQATVTEHIRRLETLLGFDVFDRVARTVILTEEGRQLLPRAQQAVRAVEQVADGIGNAVQAGIGRLTLGAIPTMSPYILPHVLAQLRREYPNCDIVVHEEVTDVLLDRLDDHSIELALLSPPIDHPRIECDTLGSERLHIVTPRQTNDTTQADITLRELKAIPRISLSNMHCLGAQIEAFCTKRNLTQNVTCHAHQLETVFELVRAGLGVSLVPTMAVQSQSTKGLRYLRLRPDAPKRDIAIATKRGRRSSMLADRFASLLDLAVNQLQQQK